jgi:hypothetical protein
MAAKVGSKRVAAELAVGVGLAKNEAGVAARLAAYISLSLRRVAGTLICAGSLALSNPVGKL